MTPRGTVATFRISDSAEDATNLKRLALLFDRIEYVRPLASSISEDALADPARFHTENDGVLSVRDFNYFRDVEHMWALQSLEPELNETIQALEEAGVAEDVSRLAQNSEADHTYRQVRDALIAEGINDAAWNALTDTDEQAYDLRHLFARIDVEDVETKERRIWWHVEEPPAVFCGDVIAVTSYLADSRNAIPLFAPDYRKLLAYWYERYRAGTAAVIGEAAVGAGYAASFGETAFRVANEVFSSDSLESCSVAEILRFRSEMDTARRKFVSEDLVELTSLVSDNPWSASARAEVLKYATGKLNADIAAYNSQSRTTWEKLYGTLSVRAGKVTAAAGIGGGTGGVAAQIIPHTSAWGMLLGGALLAASKEAPGLAKDVVAALRETSDRNRTGIAYIAKFRS